MHVAVDVTPLIGPRTGIGRFVAEVLDGLARVDDPPEIVPYTLSARATVNGARRVPLPASVALRLWRFADVPAADRLLAPATVVHGTNFAAPPTRRAARLLTVHDCFVFRHPEQCRPAVRLLAGAVRHAVRRGAHVHAVSEFTAAEVREVLGTERITVVPPGVSAPVVPGRLPSGIAPPYVLAVGTHEPRKRLVQLAREFVTEVAPATGARLVIAGAPGPDTGALESLATAHPDVVMLLGYVDERVRAALLAQATVFAHPSQYEGFGITVLEAMQGGVPVVAVDAGAVVEVAGDAAAVVPAGAFASTLAAVITDDERRSDLGRRGRERAAQFSWHATARGLNQLYRALA